MFNGPSLSSPTLNSGLSNVKHDSEYFAMLISKNDNLDIVEWVEYHKRLGCSKFYIFDHNSTTPMKPTLQQYIDTGLVDYLFSDLSNASNPQLHVYQNCLEKYGSRHKFMGFLDTDEYIVLVNKTKSIPAILTNYEQYGGLVLNWKRFGSSGHVTRPTGGVLPNYHKCFNDFRVKSIVNTQYTLQHDNNPHTFVYKHGYYAVDTTQRKARGPFFAVWQHNTTPLPPPPYVYDIMYINHYNIKSREDYANKVARGKVDNSPPARDDLFSDIDSVAIEECGVLQMPSAAE